MGRMARKKILTNPLWGPQKWEDQRHFKAFEIYRDLPLETKREIKNVEPLLREILPPEEMVGYRQLAQWAVDYKWDERVLAYDRYLDSKRTRQIERRRTEVHERHSILAMTMMNVVHQRLRSVDPDSLTARDIKEWMDVSTRIELRARGESTDLMSLHVQDGREQQVERAKEFYNQMTVESPTLSDKDKAQIIMEAFDVKPYEIGLSPDLLDVQDIEGAVH